MTILTTIKQLLGLERESFWLLLSIGKDPSLIDLYFKTTGGRNAVEGTMVHYDIITTVPEYFRGFVHTHPSDVSLEPSLTDMLTVNAWEKAMGRPLFNIIGSPDLKNLNVLYGGRPFEKRVHIYRVSSDHKVMRIIDD